MLPCHRPTYSEIITRYCPGPPRPQPHQRPPHRPEGRHGQDGVRAARVARAVEGRGGGERAGGSGGAQYGPGSGSGGARDVCKVS